jgi:hypothetical protein
VEFLAEARQIGSEVDTKVRMWGSVGDISIEVLMNP